MKIKTLILAIMTLVSSKILAQEEYYIAPLSDDVERKAVFFPNRFGVYLSGDLYAPKNIDNNKKYPAIIVGAPYGGVKEQGPCVYADRLAQKGFIVLTFDQISVGESGGEVRPQSGPEIFTESFSAAVDYLGLLPQIDRERIGVIGMCGSGGFSIAAAAVDTRIKAVCTVSMYDMSRAVRSGMDADGILKEKDRLARQRWTDAENGYQEYIPNYPAEPLDSVPADMKEPQAEWFRFYATKRGWHPRGRSGFTTTSKLAMMTFPLLANIAEISPRPLLFVIGDRAHSRFFSEDAYKAANEPKEIYIVEDAEHIDLYDRTDRIPFDKIAEFFIKSFNLP